MPEGKPMDPAGESLIREFQRNRVRLIAYIRSLVGDPDFAEDIFQEVTVVVMEKGGTFTPGRNLASWCRGIARNLIRKEWSRSRRLRAFETERIVELIDAAFEENDKPDPVEARHAALRRCMERLTPAARDLLERRYLDGLSLRRLAERLRRTEGAVQVALFRIRRALTDCVRRGPAGAENAP